MISIIDDLLNIFWIRTLPMRGEDLRNKLRRPLHLMVRLACSLWLALTDR